MRHLLKSTCLLAAAVALVALASCGKNPVTAKLTPTGSRPVPANSSVSGRITFGNGTYPRSIVLIAPVYGSSASTYSSIGVSGTLVAAGFNPGSAPLLTQLAPRFWVDTLTILQGTGLHWKFTTDLDFDGHPDYGRPGDRTGLDGLINNAVSPAAGPQGDLQADVPAGVAGNVVCALLEDAAGTGADYAFLATGPGSPAVFTSTTDGSFTITGLTPGTYNLLIRTPGALRDSLWTGIAVSGPHDLGTIDLSGSSPVGAVTGTIDWAGPNGFADLASPPYPPTTVRLVQGASTIATTTTGRSAATFSFTNVTPGTYDVVADAPVFQALTHAGLVVAAGPATDAGTFALIKTNAEVSNAINVAGDFNSWVPDDILWEMSQTSLGVWTLTTPGNISAGTQYLKFVTDYVFDNPPDYGGDEAVTVTVPATNAVTMKVSGPSTSIKASFPSTGPYTFTIDERRQVFSIQPSTAPAGPRRAGR